jgi:hypothetical protein
MYLYVLYGSQNKQRLFPYTALTYWVVITETECVYCAVQTGSSNIIHFNIRVDQVVLRQVILRVLLFFPVRIIPPMLRTHLNLFVALIRKTNGASLGILKTSALSESGHWAGKYFQLAFNGQTYLQTNEQVTMTVAVTSPDIHVCLFNDAVNSW